MAIQSTSPWVSGELSKWDSVISGRVPVLYRKNSFLFEQGSPSDYFYIVKSGRVRITAFHESGLEQQFYFALSGCLLGGSCIEGKIYTSSAIAIVDTWVYRIFYKDMLQMCQKDWDLTQILMQDLIRKQGIYRQHVISLSFHQAVHRVAATLIDLSHQFGETLPDGGIVIRNRFTHQDISNLISVSRVTVNTITKKMTDRQILSKYDKYILVTNMDALEHLASGNDDYQWD